MSNLTDPRSLWRRHRGGIGATVIAIGLALTLEFWCNPIKYVQVSLQAARPVPLVATAAAEAPPPVSAALTAAPATATVAPRQGAPARNATMPRHVAQKPAPPKPLFSLPSIR